MARIPLTAILVTLLSVFGTACGAEAETKLSDRPTQGIKTQPTSGTTRTTVYFLTDDGAAPIGVRRTIKRKSAYAREALKALLAGPTPEEEEAGITTAIPDGNGSSR
jgi:spore germination protein GerM